MHLHIVFVMVVPLPHHTRAKRFVKYKDLTPPFASHAVIEPLPEKPVEDFCGIFKDGTSLTRALLRQRREDKKHEEKVPVGLFRPSRIPKRGK